MFVRRCWYDMKSRFLWVLILCLCLSAYFLNTYRLVMKYNINIKYDPNQFMSESFFNAIHERVARVTEDYNFYVNHYWFLLGIFIFEISAIVLALGGILVRKSKSDLHMSLSLPVKRSHWLLLQGSMTALLMFILVFGLTFFTLTTNFIVVGKYYPTGMAMINALQVWLACLPFIGLSFLVNSFFHNSFKSMTIILIVIFIACWLKLPLYLLNYTFAYPFVEKLHAFSWIDFITIIMLTIGTFGLAVWKFNRNEY